MIVTRDGNQEKEVLKKRLAEKQVFFRHKSGSIESRDTSLPAKIYNG